jgi:hypothetical protein
MQDFAQTMRESNATSVEFLNIETNTGLMFATLAQQADNAEKKARNCANARLAYNTVLRFISRVSLTNAESQSLALKMAKLKTELQKLGESF